MDAGRELDALVAEQVFGMVPCDDPIGRCEWAHTIPCQCWGYKKSEKPVVGRELSCYSTDIAAAWTVVEKLITQGFEFEIGVSHTGMQVDVRLNKYYVGGDHAPCLPHAICLAALKAVGRGERISAILFLTLEFLEERP